MKIFLKKFRDQNNLIVNNLKVQQVPDVPRHNIVLRETNWTIEKW